MKGGVPILLLCFFAFASCESPTNINTSPPGRIPLDTKTQFENSIIIEQTGYNSVKVSSGDSLWVSTNEFADILLGYYSNNNFIVADTLHPTYEDHQLYYTLQFSGSFTVPDTTLYLELALKIIDKNGPIFIKKNMLMIKYPYKSSTLFMKFSDVNVPYADMADFVIDYPRLYYFDFSGPVYEYDFETKETRMLISYLFGYFLDQKNEYLFIDNNDIIKRFNLVNNTIDKASSNIDSLLNSSYPFPNKGLSVGDSSIYLLTANPYTVCEFNFDLQIINTRAFNYNNAFSLCYYNGNFYTMLNKNKVAVINANTLQLLSEHPSPTQYFREFKIYNDTIYVSDRLKGCIFKVPLSDFLSKK